MLLKSTKIVYDMIYIALSYLANSAISVLFLLCRQESTKINENTFLVIDKHSVKCKYLPHMAAREGGTGFQYKISSVWKSNVANHFARSKV